MAPARARSVRELASRIAFVAATYFLGAKLGLMLAFANRNVTTVWPPTGIAVAALLVWGTRAWPGVAIGALAANLANGAGLGTAAAITIGNTLAPLVAVYLLRRLRVDAALAAVRDVLALFFVGGLLAMTVSATGGTAALWLTHAIGNNSIPSVWLVWWVGDAIGVVLFAPLLAMLLRSPREKIPQDRALEALGLAAFAAVSAVLVFSMHVMFAYALFVPVVWAALRFDQLGAAVVTVLVSMIAVGETVAGHGPFSFLTATENLISLQTFNAAVGFTALVLATIRKERIQTESELRSSEERYRNLFEKANDLVLMHDLDGRITSVNSAGLRITGYTAERLCAMTTAEFVGPEYHHLLQRMLERRLRGEVEVTMYEIEVVAANGRRLPLEVSKSLVLDKGIFVGVQLIGRDITRRKRAEEQLRFQALHDALTGLPNRTLLHERLEYALQLARREKSQVAILLMDFDRFKDVNDTLGHQIGDMLLKQIGARLKELLRGSDTIARLGGDEFAVLVSSLPEERSAVLVAEKIEAELRKPFEIGEMSIQSQASIGIALYPDHGENADMLVQHADVAMYAAKKAGGGHIVYRRDLDPHSVRRLALLGELRDAIASDDLLLHYQPRVDMRTGGIGGVECLLRWMHPRHGILPPIEFVPLAEVSGFIQPLTSWVFERSFHQFVRWLDAGATFDLSVNVSVLSLLDGEIVDRLKKHLLDTGVPPERVRLEITESEIMDETVHSVLNRINAMGVRLAIDDFGTGFSSMIHLRRLPIDEIKIDRSFVAALRSSDEDEAIMRSMIELGHNLDLNVVAEGVEDPATWRSLVEIGCDQAQGFLVSEPLPSSGLERWLETWPQVADRLARGEIRARTTD